jgi:hypothetical protein
MKWIDKMATTPLLTHWYQLVAWQQTTLLCALGVASLSLPAQHYWQQWTQLTQLTEQQEMQQATLDHQQKILAALKEKADKHLLTPKLAGKLSAVNQQIQQLAQSLHIEHSQWDSHQTALLTLHVQGYFYELSAFLTSLLTENAGLALVEWQVQKRTESNNDSVLFSELLFQFNPEEK